MQNLRSVAGAPGPSPSIFAGRPEEGKPSEGVAFGAAAPASQPPVNMALRGPSARFSPPQELIALTSAQAGGESCMATPRTGGIAPRPAAVALRTDSQWVSSHVMSHNLIEMLRARERDGEPTAMSILKDAVRDHGEVTDDDRRRAAERSGLPEATVYGISSFYDDLTEPRGHRHVAACNGTACWAANAGDYVGDLGERLGLKPGERSEDGEVSYGTVYCLGFCHSGPAFRDGEVVDAGEGALARVAGGAAVQAEEPEGRSVLDEPVLLRPGDWSGLTHALESMSPEELLEEVKEANLRGRGGAGFPAGKKWEFARNTDSPDGKAIVVNGDEGDPGSYIDKHLMERNPDLLIEGMALAGYAVGAERGLVLVRSEYPLSMPALRAAVERAREAGHLGEDIHGSGFDFDIDIEEGAGSYVVGEETALLG